MKINGNPVARYTGTVHIMRPTDEVDAADKLVFVDLQIKVKQLHPDFAGDLEKLFPPPEAPISGTSFKDSAEGEPTRDFTDAAFVEKYTAWERITRSARIYEATIDEGIVFETDVTLKDTNPKAFHELIWEELCEGFSGQEIARWDMTIIGIDQVAGSDVLQAEQELFRAILCKAEVPAVEADADGEVAGPEPALP